MRSTDTPLLKLRLVETHLDAIGWLWTVHRAHWVRLAPSELARAHLAGLRVRADEARHKARLLLHAPFAVQVFAGTFLLLHLDCGSILNERGDLRVRRAPSLPVIEALRYAGPGGPWAFEKGA